MVVPQTESSAVKDVGADVVPGVSFPRAFAAALDRRGESLEGLRRRLRDRGHDVSLGTLSYWRSGQRRPEHITSLEALAEIEALLGLRAGELVSRVGPSSRRAPADVAVPVASAASDRGAAAQDIVDGLVAEQSAELAEQSVQVVVHVTAEHTVAELDVRTVWRALGDGARHAPVVWFEDDAATPLPTLTVVGGGRLDRDRSRPDLGILGRTLRLDRALSAGEEAVTEFVLRLPACPDRYFEHVTLRRVQDVLVWARFADGAPPSVTRYWGSARDSGSEDVDTSGTSSVHHRRRSFGPGHVGLRWG